MTSTSTSGSGVHEDTDGESWTVVSKASGSSERDAACKEESQLSDSGPLTQEEQVMSPEYNGAALKADSSLLGSNPVPTCAEPSTGQLGTSQIHINVDANSAHDRAECTVAESSPCLAFSTQPLVLSMPTHSDDPHSPPPSQDSAGIPTESTDRHNVIVFGETGAGKSSVVNMVVGKPVARSSSDAAGCTFHSEPYDAVVDETLLLKLWDTSGLNEGRNGTVSAKQAVNNLFDLIKEVEGVSLLVYCIRGPRLKATAADNYELFHQGLCHSKVPIVLVVTGLESEDNPDDWWKDNEEAFRQQGMSFAAQACVVATRGKPQGKGRMYDEEYEQSERKVQELIKHNYSKTPWKIEVNGRLGAAMNFMCRLFDIPPLQFGHIVHEVAQSRVARSEGGEDMLSAFKSQSTLSRTKSQVSVKQMARGEAGRPENKRDRNSQPNKSDKCIIA